MARTTGTRLQAVGDDEATLIGEDVVPAAPVARETSRAQAALTSLLFTSLRALSQRTVVALASLVDLALIASAFALWLRIIANPTTPQLIGVAGYAVFVLISLWLRRS
ncbi:MAG TPA: hypothetical protein VFV07_09870 [Rhizomicrobium sp.]|nr:hypothetical protein [Rhizomicrobium sp.]